MYCTQSTSRKGDTDGVLIFIVILILLLFIVPFIACNIENYIETQKQFELSSHKNVISGIVRSIELSNPKINQKTKISFKDGTDKTFSNFSPTPIKCGDYVIITFDGNNHILTVEIK